MNEIYQEILRRRRAGAMVALATIVATRGSAPREPGSKMLVTSDGQILGSVGGGYGEGETRRAALEVISTGVPRLVQIDMTADTAAREGAICGGTMLVLVEPFGPLLACGPAGN